MTIDTGDEQTGGKDPTEGQGNVVNDGGRIARAGGAGPGGRGAAGSEAERSGGPGRDDPRDDRVEDLATASAVAEAKRATEAATIEIHSVAPDKAKARRTAAADYAEAVKPEGVVWKKFEAADKDFERTAKDMSEALAEWIAANLTAPQGRVRVLLDERRQVGTRLRDRYGERERRRVEKQDAAKRWADAFAAWSKPGAKASALIGDYADKIRRLNADINNEEGRDQAIFTFWFDVAPKHLQLRAEPLPAEIAKDIEALRTALRHDDDLRDRLAPGRDRDDGSLYLDPDLDYGAKREEILAAWSAAAEDLGEAEAAYRLRPDDAAALKQRFDKLRADGWQKAAAEALKA